MIHKRIVLVLGAGASKPYGFPIGSELKTKILLGGRPGQVDQALDRIGSSIEEYESFRESYRMAGPVSIDTFLTTRPDHLDAGKIAIAWTLINYENELSLFPVDGADDWYGYLIKRMDHVRHDDGAYRHTTLEEFASNKLAIITFNYDRSFEHYLYTALLNRINAESSKVAEAVRKIPVIHIYGQLGYLPWQHDTSASIRKYTADLSADEILKAVSGINLIGQRVQSTETRARVFDLISDAPYIFFLGFGYDHENLRLLRLKDAYRADGEAPRQKWAGTAYQITREEIEYDLKNRCTHIEYVDKKCLDFLRTQSDFLGATN